MKLVAEREPLLAALQRACRVIARRDTIPILMHVHLEATKAGTLLVTATDMDREIELTLPVQVSQPGTITVGGNALRDFVNGTRDGEQVEIDHTGKDATRLVIRAGRARAQLVTLPAADFPTFQLHDSAVEFTLDGAALASALDAVAYAISNEETRYYLNGVFLQRRGPRELLLVATDGHRLGRASIETAADLPDLPSAIVPRLAVTELRALAEAGGPIAIELSDRLISVSVDDGATVLVSKLIDGTFPDTERVIPLDQPKGFECDRESLARAARRCAAIVHAEKVDGRSIRLTPHDRSIELLGNNSDRGDIVDEVDADITKAAPIRLNAKYLADTLDALEGQTVRIRYEDAGNPIRITDPADPTRLHVLMPMRA